MAAEHPNAWVAADNQAVVDASGVVFLAVLPEDVAQVCSQLTFRPDQVVAGLAAGWPPSRLAGHVAPATACQVIPLPMVSLGVGPVVLYPLIPEVETLLTGCGTLVVPPREDDITISAAPVPSCRASSGFRTPLSIGRPAYGLDRNVATEYVTSLLHGLTAESIATDPETLSDAVRAHETPGGLNQHVRQSLQARGFFTQLASLLDHVDNGLRSVQ